MRADVTGAAGANPAQFTGCESGGTGLYCYRGRYYNGTLHQFISEDPIGFAGGDINLRAYTADNPVTLIDPSGLTWASKWNYLWIGRSVGIRGLA